MELSLGCPPVHSPPLMGTGDWIVLPASPASGGESLSPHWFSAVVIVRCTAESRADGIMANIDQWLTFGRRFPFTVAVAVKQDRRLAWPGQASNVENLTGFEDKTATSHKVNFPYIRKMLSLAKKPGCVVKFKAHPGPVVSCVSFFPNNETQDQQFYVTTWFPS